MNISISAETQRLLEERLKDGEYQSIDEVLRAALAALSNGGLDRSTWDAIDEAESQIERGEVQSWEDIREQVKKRFLGN
jgi:Arc/MetJ-type ribon-helix-helix transcriptional regulator